MRWKIFTEAVVCAAAAPVAFVTPASAVDRNWLVAAGGLYNTAGNWSGGAVPQAGDNGVFNLNAGGYTVSFSAGTTSGGMIIRTDVVTLNLTGQTLTLSSNSPGLTLADQPNNLGRLTVRSGSISTNNITLAPHALGVAAATVSTGGIVTVSGHLGVGSAGLGSFNVFGGGRLTTSSSVELGSSAGAAGSITVSGAGSGWNSGLIANIGGLGQGTVRVVSGGTASFNNLRVGLVGGGAGAIFVDGAGSDVSISSTFSGTTIGGAGAGTLGISGGATVRPGDLTVGGSAGGSGFAFVDSNGSLNCSSSVTVGFGGSGEVAVSTGGRVASAGLFLASLGPDSSGRVDITGPGSSWSVTGSTLIGSQGAGTLHLSLATFTTANAVIGGGPLSRGQVIVGGSGSFTSSGGLTVGQEGAGELLVHTGGDVRSASMSIGAFPGGTGSLTVSGGGSSITATGAIVVGGNGAGTASVDATADVNCTTLTLGQFGSGRGTIVLSGTGSTWTANHMTLGSAGTGSVHVASGAALSTGSAQIGADLGSAGAILVAGNGSRWNASGNVFVGGGSISAAGAGSIEIGPGGNVLVNSATLRLYSTGEVHLSGGTLSVGSMENQGGQFNWSSGTLNFTSNVAGPTIDSFGPLGSTLELRENQTLGVNATLTIGFNGQLTIDGGRVLATALHNTSDVVMLSPTSHVTATVFNAGQLRGQGTIFGNVNNLGGGQIRAGAGETLRINGALTNNAGGRIDLPAGGTLVAPAVENFGQIFLDGGLLDASANIINQPTGRISGRGRIITAGNFVNSGSLNFAAGITDIDGVGAGVGSFNNTATGKVIVTGNSTTSFFLPVNNAAGSEMRVSSGATAVFFEPVSGLDAFTGSGTVIFESTASLGAINRLGATVVGTSAQLTAAHVRENILEVNGRATVLPNGTAAGTSRVQQLHIAGELTPIAQLDLADNDLVIDYAGASPLQTIAAQLRAGYASGAWTGDGISSSAAAAGTNHFALGFAEASSLFTSFPATFSGQTIDSTALLIAYTRYGDANLDGIVNLNDFNRLAANFGSASAIWSQGDFTYDGRVNLDDFNRLAANFGLSAGPDGVVDPQDWATLASAVPEPSVLACLWCGALLRRRRVARR